MKRWLLAMAAILFPMGAHAAAPCDPTQATTGMFGCSPTALSAAGTDYLYLWQPSLFPTAQHKITVDNLFNGRGGSNINLTSPGPIGSVTPNTGAFTSLSGSSTATGSVTSRTLADRFAERVNVRDFGAVGDNVTDDRNAFAAAMARVNTLNVAGTPTVLYIPPGTYRIKGTNGALPQFTTRTNGGAIGAGEYKSFVTMDVTYTGDLFSWSEAWTDGTWGSPFNPTTNFAGPTVMDLTITGDRTVSGNQYALHFYDRTDYMLVQNVSVVRVKGGCISTGTPKNVAGNGFLRESAIHHFHCTNGGDAAIPAMGFYSVGALGGNPFDGSDINIYGSFGPSFQIKNDAATGISNWKINGLRIEGTEGNPDSVAAHLLEIDTDDSVGGAIHDIAISHMQLSSPYTGFCAMRTTSHDAASKPYGLEIEGGIFVGGGAGKGLCIASGRDSTYHLSGITTTDTNVTLVPGGAGFIGAGITLDGNGSEQTWTWNVDAAVVRLPQTLLYKTGAPAGSVMSVAATYHDGTVIGGNGIGSGAVDLQVVRTTAAQVAASSNAVIGGGASNAITAQLSTIAGGNRNQLTGPFSAIPGGSLAIDRGRSGFFAFANSSFVSAGDAQLGITVFRGSGATASAFRLTSGGTVVDAGNCMNLPNGFAYGFSIRLHARNFTTTGTDYDWYVPNAILTRDANVASTTLALGTPVTLTRGTVTGAIATVTADTTNGCLDVEFAPPTGNTDTWHAVARIDSIEVQ